MGQNAGTESTASDGSFLKDLAERLGQYTTAKTVFGEPVEREGVTVIPVAKARLGFGGGAGGGYGPDKEGAEGKTGGQGSGGGGGSTIQPLGYIEIKDGATTFRRIYDPANVVPIILVSALVWLIFLRGLRRLLK
jgi:uncharacterized spore protein YtfJ